MNEKQNLNIRYFHNEELHKGSQVQVLMNQKPDGMRH